MEVKCLSVGQLEVNCYVVTDGGEAMVIDPGEEADKIYEYINECGVSVKRIVLTHGHFDHIGAADKIRSLTGAPICMHRADSIMLTDADKNLSWMAQTEIKEFEADIFLDEGDTFKIGSCEFTVYHTPGHSAGGITIASEKAVFAGDLIFRCSIGRFDFGDFRTEMQSIVKVMKLFDEDCDLYPGHGEITTIGYEKYHNPYITRLTLD